MGASFVERGGLYVLVQFTLFGAVIYINWATVVCDPFFCGHAPLAARICGGILAVCGLTMTVWSFPAEGPPNVFPMPTDGAPLVKTGPYAYIRHPGNLGNTLLFMGGSIGVGTPLGALSALVLLPSFFWIKNSKEESYMAAIHGAEWEAYKAQTPVRFVTFLMAVVGISVLSLAVFLNDDVHDSNPYAKAVIVLTVASCGLVVIQMMHFRTNHWLKSQTNHLLWCLAMSGAVAIANCCAAVLASPYSFEFYTQLSSLFRCLWVYHYLLLILSYFQPFGGGGKEEMLQTAGDILTTASLPPGTYAPPFRLCTCVSTYTPGTPFLRGAFRRTELYIVGSMLLACVKLTLHLEGDTQIAEDECAIEYSGTRGTILIVLDIAVIFLGLSGVLAIEKVIQPLLLPSKRSVATLRHRMFLYMQTLIAVQTVLIFGAIVPQLPGYSRCNAQAIEQLTIAVEMVLLQIFSCKAFVPKFTWGAWHHMPDLPTETEVKMMKAFQFLTPVTEMASKFPDAGKNDVQVIQKGELAVAMTGNDVAPV